MGVTMLYMKYLEIGLTLYSLFVDWLDIVYMKLVLWDHFKKCHHKKADIIVDIIKCVSYSVTLSSRLPSEGFLYIVDCTDSHNIYIHKV